MEERKERKRNKLPPLRVEHQIFTLFRCTDSDVFSIPIIADSCGILNVTTPGEKKQF
jgi:hypothetical protein